MNDKIEALVGLGESLEQSLQNGDPAFEALLEKTKYANGWFDRDAVVQAIANLLPWLKESALTEWLAKYDQNLLEKKTDKTVAVIMAGNIPLVNFHDFLCVWLQGFHFLGKLSSQDLYLLPYIYNQLKTLHPGMEDHVQFTEEKIGPVNAVIATGSNNSARYFEYYFGKYPHIIRGNRTSIGILNGNETTDDLVNFGKDVFTFYGLGCRNISKFYIPEGNDPTKLLSAWDNVYNELQNHQKYRNNYDYNKAIYLLNQEHFFDNNFVMLKQSDQLHSPVGVIYYEFYDPAKGLPAIDKTSVQCVVSTHGPIFPGQSQAPGLSDYPDHVDVMEFLNGIK